MLQLAVRRRWRWGWRRGRGRCRAPAFASPAVAAIVILQHVASIVPGLKPVVTALAEACTCARNRQRRRRQEWRGRCWSGCKTVGDVAQSARALAGKPRSHVQHTTPPAGIPAPIMIVWKLSIRAVGKARALLLSSLAGERTRLRRVRAGARGIPHVVSIGVSAVANAQRNGASGDGRW